MRQAQYGVAYAFDLPIPKAGSTDFAVSADWTPAAGDAKVLIDGVDNGNIATLPAAITGRAAWRISLSAAEMSGKEITVLIVDSATKAIVDQAETIQTYGHHSAADPRGVIRRGTAQAGAAGTITLDASASAVDDFYNGDTVYISSGTGAGQVRQIVDYVGATKVATVYSAGPPVQGAQWVTAPDATSVFVVGPEAIMPAAVTVSAGEVAATLSATQTAAIADKILGRNIGGGSDTGRTVKQSLAALRNKVTLVGTTLTIYDTDDTTSLWTGTVTLATRDSLTAVDPA